MVIPAINATSLKEAKEQLKKIETTGATMVHLDIVDGKFAPNTTWGSPGELKQLLIESKLQASDFEIHLMVETPEDVVGSWCTMGVARVVVHAEVIKNPGRIFDVCHTNTLQVMVAIGPEGNVDMFTKFFEKTSLFQILTVTPGKAGQTFNEDSLLKIKTLRAQHPNVTIEVDGGITDVTARDCKDAGATDFVSASYIISSDNPQQAYETLMQAVR